MSRRRSSEAQPSPAAWPQATLPRRLVNGNGIITGGASGCIAPASAARLAPLASVEAIVHEIEVKYRVDDLEALLVALKSRGVEISDPFRQDDQAYAPAGWQFGDSKLGVAFLRLRTVGDRHFFTLKQPTGNAQACLEYETEVTDRDAMHHAALHMGYRPTVRIAKIRRTASVGDCTLCVDDIIPR
jgi:adenylate cyclase, class 2